MNELILGVNSCGYNTSSALLRNGEVLFAVEEERIIRSLEKRSNISRSKWANGGVYVLKPNLLKEYQDHHLKKYSLEDELLPDLLRKNKRIAGFISQENFIDIGLPEDYRQAEGILSQYDEN